MVAGRGSDADDDGATWIPAWASGCFVLAWAGRGVERKACNDDLNSCWTTAARDDEAYGTMSKGD